MSDISVKRVEEFDSPNGGGFCRARASLGVTAFGMQVENFPPHFEHFPEHDHAADGQEEVYTALSGAATLHADGETYRLEPGVFARVGAGVTRKITTGTGRSSSSRSGRPRARPMQRPPSPRSARRSPAEGPDRDRRGNGRPPRRVERCRGTHRGSCSGRAQRETRFRPRPGCDRASPGTHTR